MNEILTVSKLSSYLKKNINDDPELQSLFVQGEISNFVNHLKSGHFYFTIKDSSAAIRAVMFKRNNSALRFMPENGMQVIVFGSVQLYEKTGECQFICADMQPDGIGSLYAAIEQIKTRLAEEGLFDLALKRPLPPFPKRIGVITAKTGAALQDVIRILSKRYPIGELVLIPSLVQGILAPKAICNALKKAAFAKLDVLILARGGGSIEDLWAFNDESVARAIRACPVPVITGVGHETDFTVADFVSDYRAPTPSGAAMAAAPDIGELYQKLLDDKSRMTNVLFSQLYQLETTLSAFKKRLSAFFPEDRIKEKEKELFALLQRLTSLQEDILDKKEQSLLSAVTALEALSPLKVLARGYSITSRSQKVITDSAVLAIGDTLTTRLQKGTVTSVVNNISIEKEEKYG